jgi:hypothetical protein
LIGSKYDWQLQLDATSRHTIYNRTVTVDERRYDLHPQHLLATVGSLDVIKNVPFDGLPTFHRGGCAAGDIHEVKEHPRAERT